MNPTSDDERDRSAAPLARAAQLDRDLSRVMHRIGSGAGSSSDHDTAWNLIKQRAKTLVPDFVDLERYPIEADLDRATNKTR